jgi:hypothetical protein
MDRALAVSALFLALTAGSRIRHAKFSIHMNRKGRAGPKSKVGLLRCGGIRTAVFSLNLVELRAK